MGRSRSRHRKKREKVSKISALNYHRSENFSMDQIICGSNYFFGSTASFRMFESALREEFIREYSDLLS